MPMKLIISASRNVTDLTFGSRAASVSFETEVDDSLAAEPAKLHERIRRLITVVRDSLAEELNGGQAEVARRSGDRPARRLLLLALRRRYRPEQRARFLLVIGRIGIVPDAPSIMSFILKLARDKNAVVRTAAAELVASLRCGQREAKPSAEGGCNDRAIAGNSVDRSTASARPDLLPATRGS